jgi:hypothetical protein
MKFAYEDGTQGVPKPEIQTPGTNAEESIRKPVPYTSLTDWIL